MGELTLKKYVIFTCLVLLLVSGCAYEPTIRQIDADRMILANTFEELVEVSDLIVKAKVLPGKENKVQSQEACGYTLTKLQILETFKGDVATDEIVTITEEYYQDKDGIWIDGNYLPANENQEYIFFLMKYGAKSYWSGMYYPTDLERGKYSLKDSILDNPDSIDTLSDADLEIWKDPNNEYRQWYKQVIEKYYPNH
jgi:hypothetical protein